MTVRVQCTCTRCHQEFWSAQTDGLGQLATTGICPSCCAAEGSTDPVSAALATLAQLRENQDAFLGTILPNAAALFADIRQLTDIASAPIHIRPRTFSEWLKGIDLQAQQMAQKLRAGHQADQLLKQRLEILRRYLEVAKTMSEAKNAQIEQHQKNLKACLENLKLEEEIARLQALRVERIRTEQLEETRKQRYLLNEINPPEPPPPPPAPPKEKDPLKQVVDEQRARLRAKNSAKQLTISDFLSELRKLHDARMDDTEKAARIRALMEAYGKTSDELPREVRKFLAWMDECAEGDVVNE